MFNRREAMKIAGGSALAACVPGTALVASPTKDTVDLARVVAYHTSGNRIRRFIWHHGNGGWVRVNKVRGEFRQSMCNRDRDRHFYWLLHTEDWLAVSRRVVYCGCTPKLIANPGIYDCRWKNNERVPAWDRTPASEWGEI